MRAGNLRQRVTIQEKIVTQNTFGEEIIEWIHFCTVWAAIEPLLGREFLESRQLEAEVTTRIRMRYRPGIRPEMRAVHNDLIYDIFFVQHVKTRNRELVLMCKENV